jgi:hypothetical protein
VGIPRWFDYEDWEEFLWMGEVVIWFIYLVFLLALAIEIKMEKEGWIWLLSIKTIRTIHIHQPITPYFFLSTPSIVHSIADGGEGKKK